MLPYQILTVEHIKKLILKQYLSHITHRGGGELGKHII